MPAYKIDQGQMLEVDRRWRFTNVDVSYVNGPKGILHQPADYVMLYGSNNARGASVKPAGTKGRGSPIIPLTRFEFQLTQKKPRQRSPLDRLIAPSKNKSDHRLRRIVNDSKQPIIASFI